MDDVLSRIVTIGEAGQDAYAQYASLGDGTIEKIEHPGADEDGLTLSYGSSANGCNGLGRFGRGAGITDSRSWVIPAYDYAQLTSGRSRKGISCLNS